LIIFTITSQLSGQIYVGSTRNDLQEQWEKLIHASNADLDFPLYKEIRRQGLEHFSIEEYDYVETREEAKEIEKEVMLLHNAQSLRGYKTSERIIHKKRKNKELLQKAERSLKELFSIDAFDMPYDDFFVPESPKATKELAQKPKVEAITCTHEVQDITTVDEKNYTIKQTENYQLIAQVLASKKAEVIQNIAPIVSRTTNLAETILYHQEQLLERTDTMYLLTLLTPFQKKVILAISDQRKQRSIRTQKDIEMKRALLEETLSQMLQEANALKSI